MKETYPKYKSSGVEWIGEIPKHWKVGKLYQYGKLYSGSTPLSTEEKYWENGDIPWMSSGEINKKIIREIDGRITQLGREKCNSPMLPVHTVMMGLNGQGKTKGTVGILEIETTCNQSLCGIVFNNEVIPYYQYYFLETQYYNLRGLVGEGQREGISVSFLKLYPTIIPPVPEQEQIVKYLDEKTSQIDGLISVTEKKIELLKQKRTSLINEVVTKGLNKDVELKDSGVEWIGEIPSHWSFVKLKYEYNIQKGKLPSEVFEEPSEDLIPYLSMEYLRDKGEPKYVKQTGGVFINEGDLLILWDGSNSGEILKGKKGILSSTTGVLKKIGIQINEDYSYYILKCIEPEIRNNTVGMGIPHVDGDFIRSLSLLTPPLPEQEQIVKYLDTQTTEIDKLVSIEQRRIETLKEYRQSLISEVVTGKIKVTNN
jgi:type I restriction enzyme, S subunit